MKAFFFSYAIISSMVYFLVCSVFGMDVTEEGGTTSYHMFSACLALLCSFFFYIEYIKLRYHLRYLNLSLLIMIFMIVVGISSYDPTNSHFLRYLVLCIPSSFAGLYFSEYQNAVKLIKWLDVYVLVVSLSIIISLPKFYISLLAAEEYYSQTMSYNAAFAFLLDLYLLRTKNYDYRFSVVKSKVYKTICILILPIMIFAVFFSGGRGGFVTLAVGLFLFLYFSNISRKNILKWSFISILLIIVGIVLVIQNSSDEMLGFLERSSGRIFEYLEGGKLKVDVNTTSGRNEIFNEAMALVYDRPIFGYGFYDYENYLGTYPHNIFVEWFLQGGLFFFSIALLFLIGVVLKTIRIFKKHGELLAILPLIILPFTLLLFSGRWISHPFFWFGLFFVMNFSDLHIVRKKNDENENSLYFNDVS